MPKPKNDKGLLFLLITAMLFLGAAIIWIGVPILAENKYGESAKNLSAFQRWNYSFQVLLHERDLVNSYSSEPIAVDFSIPPGASVTSVALNLQQQALISDWKAFRYYIIYKGFDTTIIAGDFILSPCMTAIDISQKIQVSYSETVSFYIYPGWRVEEIAAALPTSGIEVTPEEFLIIVRQPQLVTLPDILQGVSSLEGFLFPGSYVVHRQVSAAELVTIFIQRFAENVTPEIHNQLQAHGLTLVEGIVLASIVQRETFDDSERGLIASVFYNRLAIGMKLETDPTVQYALGYSDSWGNWWKTPLLLSDLEMQSPFNTYIFPGLPETPICNPDLPSIMAVAQPENTSYYYFRAKCDNSGSHNFSETFEEHLLKGCD